MKKYNLLPILFFTAILAVTLFVISCNKNQLTLIEENNSKNLIPKSTSTIDEFKVLSNASKMDLLRKDEVFINLMKLQNKFYDKLLKSDVSILDSKSFGSPDFLTKISYDKFEYEKDIQEAINSAKLLNERYGLSNNTKCQSCGISQKSLDLKVEKSFEILANLKKKSSELKRFRSLISTPDDLILASNFRSPNLVSYASGEVESGTECDWFAYTSCLVVCVATIELPPLAALCAVTCYCGFCRGPYRDETCR